MNSVFLLVACAVYCAAAHASPVTVAGAAAAPRPRRSSVGMPRFCPEGTIRVGDKCRVLFNDNDDSAVPQVKRAAPKPARAKRMIGMFPESGFRSYCPNSYIRLANGECVHGLQAPTPLPPSFYNYYDDDDYYS